MNFLRANAKLALFVCFLAAGCQIYSMVPAERVSIGDGFTVEPSIRWNKRSADNAQIWTVDGEALQAVHFYEGLKEGDTLFKVQDTSKQEKMPKYSAAMTLLGIRDFIEASIAQTGYTNYKTTKFQPAEFAGKDGFRIEFTFTNKNGLRNDGFATGAQVGDRLYLVIYRGARLHYYGKYLKNVEDMVRSIQLAWMQNLV